MRKDIDKLALGKCGSPPFRDGVVEEARKLWLQHLSNESGAALKDLEVVDDRQPFSLAALHEHLKIINLWGRG